MRIYPARGPIDRRPPPIDRPVAYQFIFIGYGLSSYFVNIHYRTPNGWSIQGVEYGMCRGPIYRAPIWIKALRVYPMTTVDQTLILTNTHKLLAERRKSTIP